MPYKFKKFMLSAYGKCHITDFSAPAASIIEIKLLYFIIKVNKPLYYLNKFYIINLYL